jgi:predicted MFS family arabinose efflux permease
MRYINEKEVHMHSKYFTNLVIALSAGFVVVASLAFATGTAAWVAFAFAIAVLAVTLVVQLDRARDTEQRLMDALMSAISGTVVGTSVVYGGPVVKWLVFALALGWLADAVAGLTLHEVTSWRSEHGLGELHPFIRGPRKLRRQPPATPTTTGQVGGARIA